MYTILSLASFILFSYSFSPSLYLSYEHSFSHIMYNKEPTATSVNVFSFFFKVTIKEGPGISRLYRYPGHDSLPSPLITTKTGLFKKIYLLFIPEVHLYNVATKTFII